MQDLARAFWLQRGHDLGSANFEKSRLGDQELYDISAHLQEFIPNLRRDNKISRDTTLYISEFNMGQNKIGCSGVSTLMHACLELNVGIRRIKLFKNEIGTIGAQSIAEFVGLTAVPPREIHLSHNYLAKEDVRAILIEASKRKDYPVWENGSVFPLWLRVENQLDKKEELSHDMLKEAETRLTEIRKDCGFIPADAEFEGQMICIVANRAKGCSARTCQCRHDYGPIIHMTYSMDDRLKDPPAYTNRAPKQAARQQQSYGNNSYNNNKGGGGNNAKGGNKGGPWNLFAQNGGGKSSQAAGGKSGGGRSGGGYSDQASRQAIGRGSAADYSNGRDRSRSPPPWQGGKANRNNNNSGAARGGATLTPAKAHQAPVNRLAKPKPEEDPLPFPWEKQWSDEYQIPYFWNSETGDSQWERPTA